MQNSSQEMGGKSSCSRGHRYDMMMNTPGSAYMPYSGEGSYGGSGQQEGGSGQYNNAGQFESGSHAQSGQYQNNGQQYSSNVRDNRYGRNEQQDSKYQQGYGFDNRFGMQQRRNSFNGGDERRGSFSDRRNSMEQRNNYGMNPMNQQRNEFNNMGRRHSFDMNRRNSYSMNRMDRRNSFGMNQRRESYSLDRMDRMDRMNRMDRMGCMDRKDSFDRRGSFSRFGDNEFNQFNRYGREFPERREDQFRRFDNQEFGRFGSQDFGRFGNRDFDRYNNQEFDRFDGQDFNRFDGQDFNNQYNRRYGSQDFGRRGSQQFDRYGRDQFNRHDRERFGRFGNDQFNRNDQFFGPREQFGQQNFPDQFGQFDRFGNEQFGRFDQFRRPANNFGQGRFGVFGGFGSDFGSRFRDGRRGEGRFNERFGDFNQFGRNSFGSFGERGFGGFNQSQFGRNPFQGQNNRMSRQHQRGSFDDRFRRNSIDNRFRSNSLEGFRRPASFDNQRRNSMNEMNGRFRSGSYDAGKFPRGSMDENQFRRPSYDNQYRRFSYDNQDRRGSYDQSPQDRFGMKFGQMYSSYYQQMPAPIPPFSEPRSVYPNTMEFCYDEEDRYGRYRMSRAREMAVRANYNLLKKRYSERPADSAQNPCDPIQAMANHPQGMPGDVLAVDFVDFKSVENAKDHVTFCYEAVQEFDRSVPVYRRGQPFAMNIAFRDRNFDANRDCLFINFYYGPNPSVPKKTRVVLPINAQRDFTKGPNQWDVRILNQEQCNLTLQIHIPAHCQVGQWFCVVETSKRDVDMPRFQYRCPEEIYIIFNPFCREDAVYMENDAHRNEYVMNDTGKIYTGGFRSVKGRPWVFGQFEDCVLPAACVLLEMSQLTHAERGNPAKVARALSSMIQAHRNRGNMESSEGLIQTRYEDDFRGGMSPHAFTGSVQILEEFLRSGASPVKYAQCWVMTGLMTTLCRALGLPCRPVTAFVTAHDTQDAMTVDRYIDRFGDLLERGPGRDQPDSVWSYHTWCDIWMLRPDLPSGYSGWQGTDPSRTYRDYRDMFSGSCGPASSEAVKKGDVGSSHDIDAFYSCLNASVRYFFEDEGSDWGFSPFRQYRYPVGRYILTKAVGRSDDEGVADAEEITALYRDMEKSDAERFATFNAARGHRKEIMHTDYQACPNAGAPYPPPEQATFDVSFELLEPVRVMVGQPMVVTLQVHNNSNEVRTIRANISSRACFYNGVMGPHLKRVTGQYTLGGGQSDVLTLRLDPPELQGRLVDQGFIKITSSGFVQESLQTYIDEYDFRFEKPKLDIEIASECKVGQECPVNFMFQNPLGISLTDCFLTYEIGNAVRPRTIKINRDVRPGEPFTFSHSFRPGRPGDRKIIASFVSRQLQDVTGQARVEIRE